jgi:SRSO17 transposase
MNSSADQEPDRSLKGTLNHLSKYLEDYHDCFRSETFDGYELCRFYINGLFKTESGKLNIERINEEIEMPGDSYQQVQQFISDSPWSSEQVIRLVAQNTSDQYEDQPDYRFRDVGYIIDESAHLKKGRHSVGVARQYAGVIGKVDNCQVGVYSSLVWQCHSTLINCRLFLPESWTSDQGRCERAGIPPEARVFKTKQELALDMIKADMAAGVRFSWVGGDGLYGHGHELSNAIENMGLTFLFDVHNSQMIYTVSPRIVVPEKQSGPGRAPTKPQTDTDPITVKQYSSRLSHFEWQDIKYLKLNNCSSVSVLGELNSVLPAN